MTTAQLACAQKLQERICNLETQLFQVKNWQECLRENCRIQADTGSYVAQMSLPREILQPFLLDLETKIKTDLDVSKKAFADL